MIASLCPAAGSVKSSLQERPRRSDYCYYDYDYYYIYNCIIISYIYIYIYIYNLICTPRGVRRPAHVHKPMMLPMGERSNEIIYLCGCLFHLIGK